MSGTSGDPHHSGRLSPEQRARLQETITAELRRAWDEAVAAGVPADLLAGVVERRHRELLSALAGADDVRAGADDLRDGRDDTGENGRVGN